MRTNRNVRRVWDRTRSTVVAIGDRRSAPARAAGPAGLSASGQDPCVDCIHVGDLEGVKGVYHINVCDEATQWQNVATVAAISER